MSTTHQPPAVTISTLRSAAEAQAATTFILRNLHELYGRAYDHPRNQVFQQLDKTCSVAARQQLILAKADEQIIGTMLLSPAHTGYAPPTHLAVQQDLGYVSATYVDPAWRSQGIGSRMLQETLTQAKVLNYHLLFLHTHHELASGYRFWQRHGFVTYRYDIPPTGWDIICMARAVA